MSVRRKKPVPPELRESARDAIRNLKNLPDYFALKPGHTVEALMDLDAESLSAEAEYDSLCLACDKARDRFVASTWAVQDRMQDVKVSVMAQYGADSPEVTLFGLKRKSNYKPRTRRKVEA